MSCSTSDVDSVAVVRNPVRVLIIPLSTLSLPRGLSPGDWVELRSNWTMQLVKLCKLYMLGAKLQVQFTQHLQRSESSASPVSGLHFGIGSTGGHQFSASPAAPVGRDWPLCWERFCLHQHFVIHRYGEVLLQNKKTTWDHCSSDISEALQHFMPYAFAPLCFLSDPIYAQSEAEKCTPGVSCIDPDRKHSTPHYSCVLCSLLYCRTNFLGHCKVLCDVSEVCLKSVYQSSLFIWRPGTSEWLYLWCKVLFDLDIFSFFGHLFTIQCETSTAFVFVVMFSQNQILW